MYRYVDIGPESKRLEFLWLDYLSCQNDLNCCFRVILRLSKRLELLWLDYLPCRVILRLSKRLELLRLDYLPCQNDQNFWKAIFLWGRWNIAKSTVMLNMSKCQLQVQFWSLVKSLRWKAHQWERQTDRQTETDRQRQRELGNTKLYTCRQQQQQQQKQHKSDKTNRPNTNNPDGADSVLMKSLWW